MEKHLNNMWRIVSTFVSLIVLSCAVIVAPVSAQAEQPVEYNTMEVEVNINEKGRLEVTELITVTYNDERRGIFRYIPSVYLDGVVRSASHLQFIDVKRNGSSETYESIDSGPYNKAIRIGNESVYLEGQHVYEIRYTLKDVIIFEENHDELFWNVTGNNWEYPFEEVVANFYFPAGAEVKQLNCFTGAFGSTAQACVIESDLNRVTVTANDYVSAGIVLEKGTIREPGVGRRTVSIIWDNVFMLIAILNILGAILLWYKHGRDPKIKTIVAEYEPPEGFSVGELATYYPKLKRKNLFTALIVSLAQKGYIRMETEERKLRKDNVIFHKLKELDESVSKLEKEMFEDVLRLKNKNQYSLDEIRKNTSSGIYASGLMEDIQKIKRPHGIFKNDTRIGPALYDDAAGLKQGVGLFLNFFFGIGLAFVAFLLRGWPEGVAIIASAVIAAPIYFLVRRRTPEGTEMMRRVLGYKEFIHVAERYRAQWQEKIGEFEKVLPYAILFGDAEHWMKIINDIQEVEMPSYLGTNLRGMAAVSALSSIGDGIGSAISTSASSSSSGSSGGGGFSGGGSGGGGGGSW